MPQPRVAMRKIRDVLHYRHTTDLSLQAIGRALGLSKGVVSKYLGAINKEGLDLSQALALSDTELERLIYRDAPKRESTFVQPDCPYIYQELKRKGVTLQLLWEEYSREAGEFALKYTAFCNRYRTWSLHLKLSMRQVHRAGEKMFADYSGATVPLVNRHTGEITQAQIFVATLGASNYTYACATPGQTKADWLHGIEQALWFFGGVPVMLVPDNPKPLVDRVDSHEPQLNPTVEDFAHHYGTVVLPARVRKPQDKAKVEVSVQIVQRWILARLRHCRFFSLQELNVEISLLLKDLNNRPFKKLPGCRKQAFDTLDAPYLKALPSNRYEMAEFKTARVNLDYHIEYAGHYYSVPSALVRQKVQLRITQTALEVYAKNKRVAIHAKSDRKGAHSTIAEHMPAAHRAHHEWTPSKFIAWAHQVGTYTAELVEQIIKRKRHPEQSYRSCMGLKGLRQKYGDQRLEAASRWALLNHAYTARSVRSILQKGLDKLPDRQEPTELKLPEHDNVRGSKYYH